MVTVGSVVAPGAWRNKARWSLQSTRSDAVWSRSNVAGVCRANFSSSLSRRTEGNPATPTPASTSVVDNYAECSTAPGVDRDRTEAEANNPSLLHPHIPTTSGRRAEGFKIPRPLQFRRMGRFPVTTSSFSHRLRSQSRPRKTRHKFRTNTTSLYPRVDHTTFLQTPPK